MVQVALNNLLSGKSYPEAGAELGTILGDAIQNEDTVQIDMDGVDAIPTMFMTTSFGNVIGQFGIDKLKKAMLFRNITNVQIERIGKYMKDYMEVYGTSK